MSKRPKDGDTGVNTFMLIFIFVFFGSVALYTIFGPQGDPMRPSDVNHAVTNNLRALATAAEQYFLDHGGTSVRSSELIGTNSSQYLKPFATVAGETYPQVIVKGAAVTASGIAGARTVTFGP